ncbi:hypothetical protein KO500_11690 [Cellulophaga baltica]|uniref:hypothetical protein n=1 Tax=Cellulophaga TaxID=104264 RepID=UPI001C079959|nr:MULTISPECIES: hypothetical protein [Cellulophaga]MBU2997101.1 hypothetical protein [Cellulophaga baltica]MDO6768499.1 hypothetical protein [Cellulophaga sp. 1_MG-2023]
MSMAADNEWISLTEWRKIELKNDTLYFDTFGEWRESSRAQIKYVGKDKIQLRILETNKTIELEPIYENLNFEKPKKLWDSFIRRLNSHKCE